MKSVLEIGAMENPERGYKKASDEEVTTLDIQKSERVDVIHNLEKYPYPFDDNQFDKIYASHVMEHLTDTLAVMKELHRITKPGGKIVIIVPHFSGYTAWSNPDHKKAFAADAFHRFGKGYKVEKLEIHYTFMGDKRPLPIRIIDKIMNGLANANQHFCERFWCYAFGGFTEIYAELKVVK